MLLFLLIIGLCTLFLVVGLMINEAIEIGMSHVSYQKQVDKVKRVQEINKFTDNNDHLNDLF